MGRKVVPGGVGAIVGVCGGVCGVDAGAKLFALCDFGQVVAVRSAEPLARSRGLPSSS